jgi:hypothetical protein
MMMMLRPLQSTLMGGPEYNDLPYQVVGLLIRKQVSKITCNAI